MLPQFDLFYPDPAQAGAFGTQVLPLKTGKVVVTDPTDNLVASHSGAVYLYDGLTGALLSTLTGSHANDQVGFGGVAASSSDGI